VDPRLEVLNSYAGRRCCFTSCPRDCYIAVLLAVLGRNVVIASVRGNQY